MSAEEEDDARRYEDVVLIARRLLAGWHPVHDSQEGWRWRRMGDRPIPFTMADIGAMSDIWWEDEEPAEPPPDQYRELLAQIANNGCEFWDGPTGVGCAQTRGGLFTGPDAALLRSLARPSSPRGETPDA